jgi:hypothetical protein
MKRSEEDRLLREILTDEPLDALRQRSLDGGISLLRRRRATRAVMSGIAAVTVVIAVLVIQRFRLPPPSEPVHASIVRSSTVTMINDEQLLALFPNRAVALIGRPGHQKLLLADDAHRP